MPTPTAAERSIEAVAESTLLGRLGLPVGASAQDVDVAHDGLVDFLESAPLDLQPWARRQVVVVDEAYALLSDPTIDRATLAEAPEDAPVQPQTQDARHTERARRRRPADTVAVANVAPTASTGRARLLKRVSILAAAAVGVVVIAIVGFNLDGGTGIPPVDGSPQPAAAASPAIDTAKVADLMGKVQADPNDKVSYQSLADIYYLAGEFESAGGFLEKVLAIDPKDVTARLALGAALYNLGKSDGAEAQWRQVLASEPDNLEAHYDLGFMFLSATPPDIANVRLEWGKVIQIAPDSDVAKTVATHLATLDASPAPSSLVSPSQATPSVSPAPVSPAPSAK